MRTHQKAPNNSEKPKSTKKCQTTQKRKVQRRNGTSLLLPLGTPWLGSWARQWREEKRKERIGGCPGGAGQGGSAWAPLPCPGGSCQRRATRTSREATGHPDLHVSEVHSHARQCLPAARRRPAPGQGFAPAAAPQPGAREPASQQAPRRASHLTQPAPRCRRD